MTIKEQLMADMKAAMRAKEMDQLTTIRFLMSEIKNYEIDNGEQDDAGMQKVIASQVKKSKDAISDYQAADRRDLVDQERVRVSVMEKYLPAQLTDEQLDEIVAATLQEVGTDNLGQVIGAVMKKVASQADGNRVSAAVKRLASAA